ncbi:hypothetical protein ACWGBY_18055 [Streptomyces griseus]|uniref:Uncharacterized protein n=1 Tax=Streptomyces sp. CMC78 TaxID=3231512 RepID=A0AB33KID8_9ACTN|nr:hypothetical protein [Streptomyces sp. ID01-9D]MDX5572210.1 hypothetical protein [Streptomyces sp. ID01-9D]WSV24806.1 hypothetical protein OG554_32485 [Streptomyces fimicarius]WTC86264.1 hypothetical protein OH733_05695 [Streptomyces griseus]WTD71118.1 hypothetical protein OH763_31290 [Streptomyces griseus]
MSVFPKRTVRGGQVTIHCAAELGRLATEYGFPLLTVTVTEPGGGTSVVLERHLLAVGITPPGPPRSEMPLLAAVARLESADNAGQETALTDLMETIRTGVHHYAVHPVPADAPLGRYTFTIELWVDGRCVTSRTADTDAFFVEKVSLRELRPAGATTVAVVRNEGPEPVPARLVSLPCGETPLSVRDVDLPPASEHRLSVAPCCSYLLHSEQREILALFDPATHLLRDQRVSTVRRGDATYLVDRQQGQVFELSEKAEALWRAADGTLRADALAAEDEHTYELLRETGCLREVPFT